jgi:hypothetical protein
MKKKKFWLIISFNDRIGFISVMLNHLDAKIAFVSIFCINLYVLFTGIYLQLAYKTFFSFEKKLSK